jgi:putative endonuclease
MVSDSPPKFQGEGIGSVVKKKKDYRKRVGREGEDKGVGYLREKGWTILERNYRAERGEIDIVALDGDVLVFVEVKTKRHNSFGEPESWVDQRKQMQIGKVAQAYIQQHNIYDKDCRFDVIGIVNCGQNIEIRHIKDAFWLES